MIIPAEARPASKRCSCCARSSSNLPNTSAAFLLVEIWSAPLGESSRARRRHERLGRQRACRDLKSSLPRRGFRAKPSRRCPNRWARTRCRCGSARVVLAPPETTGPARHEAARQLSELKAWNCFFLGVKVRPVYRDATTHELFPVELRSIRRSVNNAFKQAYFAFTRQRTDAAAGPLSCARRPLGRQSGARHRPPTGRHRPLVRFAAAGDAGERRKRLARVSPLAIREAAACFTTGRWRSIPRCSSASST